MTSGGLHHQMKESNGATAGACLDMYISAPASRVLRSSLKWHDLAVQSTRSRRGVAVSALAAAAGLRVLDGNVDACAARQHSHWQTTQGPERQLGGTGSMLGMA